MPLPEMQHDPVFLMGDARLPERQAAGPPAAVVQWMTVISAGYVPLWSPVPLPLAAALEQMHAQEVRHPSTADLPRTFHLPLPDFDSAQAILFGTNIPFVSGMSVKVNMRTGVLIIPVLTSDPAMGQPGLHRPLRRVLLTHTHA